MGGGWVGGCECVPATVCLRGASAHCYIVQPPPFAPPTDPSSDPPTHTPTHLCSPGAAYDPTVVIPVKKDHVLPVAPRVALHPEGEAGLVTGTS